MIRPTTELRTVENIPAVSPVPPAAPSGGRRIAQRLALVALLLPGLSALSHAQDLADQELTQAQRWTTVSETLLPELARPFGAGARNAVTECIDEAMEPGSGDASSSFTACTGGEYRDMVDETGRDPIDWANFVRSVHVGGNLLMGESMAVGAALSWFDGRFDYVDGRGDGRESQYQTRMVGIHPYLAWFWDERVQLWATAGYNWGETTIEDFSSNALQREESDSSLSTAAAGGSLQLTEQSDSMASFRLKAEGWATWLKLDENGANIEETDVEASGGRLAIGGAYEFSLADHGMLRPELEVGARYDSGDGAEGFGVETLAGLRYAQGRWNLIMRGRTLLVHEGDMHDWSVHGVLALDPAAGGMGWSARLGTNYGLPGSNAAAQPWGADLRGAAVDYRADQSALAMWTRAEAGYGIGLWRGLLTPYGALDLGQGGNYIYSLGARAQLESGLLLHVKGERREYDDSWANHGRGGTDHRLWFDLEVPLSDLFL